MLNQSGDIKNLNSNTVNNPKSPSKGRNGSIILEPIPNTQKKLFSN